MKRVIKSIMLVSILSIIAGHSCSNKNENQEDENPNPNEEVEYPIEIPFEEYSLAGTSCKWADFDNSKWLPTFFPSAVVIINNNEELGNYIVCTDNSYPTVDFSKYSFLCVSGWASGYPADVMKTRLQQISANEYSLYLEIRPGVAAVPGPWNISIIVSKMRQNSIVALDVVLYKPNK